MDRLSAARQRLYAPSTPGNTRAMLIRFNNSSDWDALATLYQAVQDDLQLPAPAISVDGGQGYGLWFSLSAPVTVAVANAFLTALRERFLTDIPPARLELLPDLATLPEVPRLQADGSRWSAYIDPTLGSMFTEEPWLEMAPNPDKQADLLASLECAKPDDFARALAQLTVPPTELAASPGVNAEGQISLSNRQFADPQAFLLAVMNDASVSTAVRVEAAKALLPYFTLPRSG